MPFDFNDASSALTIYGIFPQSPFPVELSVYGYCQMACAYCFSNRNRDAFNRELNDKNSTPAIFRKIDRAVADEFNPLGFFLREKYPVVLSNRSDPFQRQERTYRSSLAVLNWARATRTPLFIQTRGADLLLEDWETYAPYLEAGRVVVYLSICHLDDKDRKFIEPGAPSLERRWELARRLRDHGIPVIAACNPYVKDWVPDPYEYCRLCKESGVRGIWLEALHFTSAQADTLARPYRDLLFKSNVQPMYLIGDLKHWYAACKEHGLDLFPTPRWDAYFGHDAAHPECADPAWLGGKTLDFAFRLMKGISNISRDAGKKMVLFGWAQCAQVLQLLGVPNPVLDTGPFWYPYNAAVKADKRSWNAALGRQAPLYEVLRYFWNHPYECQHLVWYHPLVQALWYEDTQEYATDEDGNLLAVFNPAIKHHGSFTLDASTVNLDEVIRPNFGFVEPA